MTRRIVGCVWRASLARETRGSLVDWILLGSHYSPRIDDSASKVEPTLAVEPVLRDPIGVPDESRGGMLILDELDEPVGPDACLVAQREAFRKKLDETKLHRVSNEPSRQCQVDKPGNRDCLNKGDHSLECHGPLDVAS